MVKARQTGLDGEVAAVNSPAATPKGKGPGSDIPVGTMFSPGTIHLPSFVRALVAHSGDRDALIRAVNAAPVKIGKAEGTARSMKLPLEAAAQYGLLTRTDWEATALCKELATKDDATLYEDFARHILLSLRGLDVVETARQIVRDEALTGVRITGPVLARALTSKGMRVTEQNMQINSMRGWLAMAGIYPKGKTNAWQLNQTVLDRIIDMSTDEIDAIADWSPEHRELALALCRMDHDGPIEAAEVRDAAEAASGLHMPRSSLPDLFEPLVTAGYVKVDPGLGTRRGKSALITILPKFDADVLSKFLLKVADRLDQDILTLYKMEASQIKADLTSPDTYRKGVALEAYAARLMRLLDLRLIRWRLRSEKNRGAEVDLVLGGMYGGIPTRWQVQCKNTPGSSVDVGTVAKEVGLAALTKATHIVMITNGYFSNDAQRFADAVMENSTLTIYLLGSKEFQRVLDSNTGDLPAIFREHGERIVTEVGRRGLEWLPED